MRKKDVTQWDIAVLGAGTMGLSIAQLFAMNRHTVYLYNRTPANLEKALMESADKKTAVLNKAIPGFILNRITMAVFREASYIAENGWATPEDIDQAIVSTFGPRYTFEGPFALSAAKSLFRLSGTSVLGFETKAAGGRPVP